MNQESINCVEKFLSIAYRLTGKAEFGTVFEIGARDCIETLIFHKYLPNSEIFTFECNPATIPICRANINMVPNIHLIEKAVANIDGTIPFFQIDQEKTESTWEDGNPGASSLLMASGKYPIEKYVQKEIQVPVTKLSTFIKDNNISNIDLLWIDVQGAEDKVLEGLEEKIHKVGVIQVEVSFMDIYKDQPLFDDIRHMLKKRGFLFFGFKNQNSYFGDAVFINRSNIQGIQNVLLCYINHYKILWKKVLRNSIIVTIFDYPIKLIRRIKTRLFGE